MDNLTTPIVADSRFVLATRDTGYRSPATALAELIDNSLQAAAKSVSVRLQDAVQPGDLWVAAIDDGNGMDAATLRTALQFGGTPRFNDRAGQGRSGQSRSTLLIREAPQVVIGEEEPTGKENNVESPTPIMDFVDDPTKERAPRRILRFASNIAPGDTCRHDTQDTPRTTVPKILCSLSTSRHALTNLAHPGRNRGFVHRFMTRRSYDPCPEES